LVGAGKGGGGGFNANISNSLGKLFENSNQTTTSSLNQNYMYQNRLDSTDLNQTNDSLRVLASLYP